MWFLTFMQSTQGRLLRIAAGATLVSIGAMLGTLVGVLLMVVGLIPVVTGISNVSLFEELIADLVVRGRRLFPTNWKILRGAGRRASHGDAGAAARAVDEPTGVDRLVAYLETPK